MAKNSTTKEAAAPAPAEAAAPLARGEGWAKATEVYEIPVALERFWLGGKKYDMRTITKAHLLDLEKAGHIKRKEKIG